ncbi:MAG: restriction endonuclease [Proteobacteria bacterium]|nr:restriction endonuclease [Pseudomonadota bacterium]
MNWSLNSIGLLAFALNIDAQAVILTLFFGAIVICIVGPIIVSFYRTISDRLYDRFRGINDWEKTVYKWWQDKPAEEARLLKIKTDLDQQSAQLVAYGEKLKTDYERRLLEIDNQRQTDRQSVEIVLREKSTGFPWLASAVTDFLALRDEKVPEILEVKKHPAIKSAEIVRQAKAERRTVEKLFRIAKYRVEYYESLFPWLEEYVAEDIDELISQQLRDKVEEQDDDPVKRWIPKGQYEILTPTNRNQLALDRWNHRPKSSWQIGLDYERFIGYCYEQDGFNVLYHGARYGIADLGRDLICKKGEKVEIVQCKYWAKHKQIHEAFINQLFGTYVKYLIENNQDPKELLLPSLMNSKHMVAVMVTSTVLSETAKQFAEALHIKVIENKALESYPQIKCNISKRTGEHIYHLPFDQQYDKTLIEEEKNECYVSTVAEAEKLGYRRAYRWHGNIEINAKA